MAPERRPVVVFAGAPVQPTDRLRQRLAALSDPHVLAADSGAKTALAFGLRPHLVIGDLDSLDESTHAALEGVRFETYPRAKDATDSQLAVEHALQREPTELLLLGFLNGPRLDMTLGNTLLLLNVPNAILLDERNEACVLTGPGEHTWQAEPDELISLLPLTADCHGVTTRNMLYPLNDETLHVSASRGISNEPTAPTVGVSLASGKLLITRHFAPPSS